MKVTKLVVFAATLFIHSSFAISSENRIETIDDYNAVLPYWGTVWNPGSGAVNRYYPSFYTGFAPRSQLPEKIHVRTSRGNQTRVTVVLDDQTLRDYLFDLVKRYETYAEFSRNNRILKIAPESAALKQLEYFNSIIESPVYGILPFVDRAKNGLESDADILIKSLTVMQALNPGRIFNLNFNLRNEFVKWGDVLVSLQAGRSANSLFTANSKETVIALNMLLLGRVNYTQKPSDLVIGLLQEAARLNSLGSEREFVEKAYQLLGAVTGDKFKFYSVNDRGVVASALSCVDLDRCQLSYSEFTAVYPTGSAEAFTVDRFGNRILDFATPGLWQFMSYNSSGRDFDNVRKEPYYGFIPKMDFEGIGNGFHNPAVTFWSVGNNLKSSLNIPQRFSAFGAVKRGGVSSGCLRLPVGHLWELRHIFPVENAVATKVHFFGNDSKDFDVFDINGDGILEVMGVDYMISYSVAGAGGLAKRDGGTLDLKNKIDFAAILYGKSQVFEVTNERIVFNNPTVSFPSHLDWKKKSVATSYQLNGKIPLYEQTYERDKIQFYTPATTSGLTELSQAPISKRIVRLMGRIRGCAPSSDKGRCGQTAYESEASSLLKELKY